MLPPSPTCLWLIEYEFISSLLIVSSSLLFKKWEIQVLLALEGILNSVYLLIILVLQIEALKEIGVDEVVLAINYQPEVRIVPLLTKPCSHS